MGEINRFFDRPVYLADGPNSVCEISDAADAIEFLEEWPPELRDTASEVALRVCRRAHDGLIPTAAARNAIEGFARMAGILEDEAVTVSVPASYDNNDENDGNCVRIPSFSAV
ncbi:DUF982 domain-containing protein [Mesorhizobium sp. ASY16-5R]|uniref:DUF982 domain-containing protein n=1 Tax=Mesorhizobium sp. ASY16-5R TaxID=3445772 RepID=UPI003F9EE1FD